MLGRKEGRVLSVLLGFVSVYFFREVGVLVRAAFFIRTAYVASVNAIAVGIDGCGSLRHGLANLDGYLRLQKKDEPFTLHGCLCSYSRHAAFISVLKPLVYNISKMMKHARKHGPCRVVYL